MKPDGKNSLKLDKPLEIGTLLRALLAVLLVLLAAEGLARTQQNKNESLGNYHYQFEIKWFHLQQYVERFGGVDVIILGSSLVNSGMDPDAINQSWSEASGEEPLRIFNFGVEGLTIQPNSLVAELLIETYHPQVLVFGTEIRDYAANNGVEVAEKFLSDPWVQYKQGQFSLRGWLADHSAAYRLYLAYRNWMTWEFADNLLLERYRTERLTRAGYDAETRTSDIASTPPDPNNPEDAAAFETFADFEIAPSRLENLKTLLTFNEQTDTQIILLEMPVSPSFYAYFENGLAEHDNFVDVVSRIADTNSVLFLPAPPEDTLPPESRSDRVHLNETGAEAFSQMIGEWLAGLYANGLLEVEP